MTQSMLPQSIQAAVDQYLELYQVAKQLEERMKELRAEIEPYMLETGVQEIGDTKRTGRVQIHESERTPVTARFSTYPVDDIRARLSEEVAQKCIVQVVDKDKLEALAKLGEVESDVLQCKLSKSVHSFQVRLDSKSTR